jgi:hypothetical protein
MYSLLLCSPSFHAIWLLFRYRNNSCERMQLREWNERDTDFSICLQMQTYRKRMKET